MQLLEFSCVFVCVSTNFICLAMTYFTAQFDARRHCPGKGFSVLFIGFIARGAATGGIYEVPPHELVKVILPVALREVFPQ